MKKNSTVPRSPIRATTGAEQRITIGIDLGYKTSCHRVLNRAGEVIQERKAATTRKGLAQAFVAMRRCRIAIEVGMHSP